MGQDKEVETKSAGSQSPSVSASLSVVWFWSFQNTQGFPAGSAGKESACNAVQLLGQEGHLEKG